MNIYVKLPLALFISTFINQNAAFASEAPEFASEAHEDAIRATIQFAIEIGELNPNNTDVVKRGYAIKLLEQQNRDLSAHQQAAVAKEKEGAVVAAQKPAIYEFVVIDSPSVHNLTDKITLADLKAAKYDLSKFRFKFTLDEKTFTWNGQPGTESEVVKKIIANSRQLNLSKPLAKLAELSPCFQTPVFNCRLLEVVCLYQEIEAEGVFYRDLKAILDKQHMGLLGDKEYDAMRTPNYGIVNEFFNITEGLSKSMDWILTILGGGYKRLIRKDVNPTDTILNHFQGLLYGNAKINNGIGLLQETRQKVTDLRKKYGLVSM